MKKLILYLLAIVALQGCGIYSFSGTSIAPDVHTIFVATFDNRAQHVNPQLSNALTEGLKEKYRRQTKLRLVNEDGDLEVEGVITSYATTAIAVTAAEVASQNRLTVTVKVSFVNHKYPKENFEKSYAAFEDYASTLSLDAVEGTLIDGIIEKLGEQIFNDTVANW